MAIYTLKFAADRHGEGKSVQFEAHDASNALIIAHQVASQSEAVLWCDGRALCTIKRTGNEGEIWHISPPPVTRG